MNTWIGIDIAKKSVVTCVWTLGAKPVNRKFDNTAAGHEKFLAWAASRCELADCHFCMESTGVYGFELACTLAERGLLVSVENPRKIKHMGIALGLKCKTDKVDAFVIARYAQSAVPRRWVLSDPKRREISQLRNRARQISTMRNMESNRLENTHLPDTAVKQIRAHINLLDEQERQIEEEMAELLNQCEEVAKVFDAVTKLKGVGPICGIAFAVGVDVRSLESASEVGAFVGLSPRRHESGSQVGQTRITKQGDSSIRSAFCYAARSAARFNPVLKDFYQRLLAKGLKKKQAWAAVGRKLVIYCWAIARRVLAGLDPIYPGGIHESRVKWRKKSLKPLTC